ncbi:MAG TPA: PAS domain S-box protein [Planctomycetota bacterium]|nr:PAS domain S-box protein [Planctomycetota bacterium]
MARFFDLSTQMLAIATFEGDFVRLNPAWEKALGYSRGELRGKPLASIVHPEDGALLSAQLDLLQTATEALNSIELRCRRLDGSYRWLSWNNVALGAERLIYVTVHDITQRKTEENALRESEERLRLLVEGVHNYALVMLDLTGRVLTWNAGAERVHGYKSDEILGRSFSIFEVASDVAAGKPEKLLKLALEQGVAEDEGWRVRADGTRFWANVLLTALKDQNARLTGFSKVTRDLTAKKQAETLLKAADLQNAIFNSSNFSSIATDERGVIQIFNVGAERMLGYAACDVLNRVTPADISDPLELIERARALSLEFGAAVAPGFEALVFKASRGIEDNYEQTYVRKDGSRFSSVVSVAALRDAQAAIIGYLLIGTDNSARMQVQESLLESQAQQRTIVENISEGVVVSDLDGQLLHFNCVALDLLGYTSLEQGRRYIIELADTFELCGLDGTPWPVSEWPLARILRGEKLSDLEGRMRRIGEDWDRCFSFGGNIALDATGQPRMAIVTFRDVTERKLARDVASRMNAELEQRVAERTAQLLTANNEMEAFSYSVSHDLRAPLRSLDGFSQALIEDCADKLTEDDLDNLKRIRSASQRMGQLIEDLLKLSRMTRAEMSLQRVDLSKLACEVLDELRSAEPGRGVEFEIQEGLIAGGDQRLLRIALTNLFSNAWKFTGRRADSRIEFGCSGPEDARTYFVRDNGVGYDMAHAGKLFGAFQRLHAIHDFPGTGIGLVTVQRIVHRHGGRIWAESTLGQGATFHFTL